MGKFWLFLGVALLLLFVVQGAPASGGKFDLTFGMCETPSQNREAFLRNLTPEALLHFAQALWDSTCPSEPLSAEHRAQVRQKHATQERRTSQNANVARENDMDTMQNDMESNTQLSPVQHAVDQPSLASMRHARLQAPERIGSTSGSRKRGDKSQQLLAIPPPLSNFDAGDANGHRVAQRIAKQYTERAYAPAYQIAQQARKLFFHSASVSDATADVSDRTFALLQRVFAPLCTAQGGCTCFDGGGQLRRPVCGSQWAVCDDSGTLIKM